MLVFILVLLASCQNSNNVNNDFYFDTEEYIKTEVISLKKQVKSIIAKIDLNGESEIQNFKVDSTTSFNDLENLFTQVNINKAVFENEYEIDTFWILNPETQENIEVINYIAKNDKMKVSWIQVYNDGSLKAKITEKNFLFSYEKEIYYQKDLTFSTISWQKTIGLDTLRVYNELKYQY